MKGIVFAESNGKRLRPFTGIYPKHIHYLYDLPVISFPVNTIIDAGIEDIIVIATSREIEDTLSSPKIQKALSRENFSPKIRYHYREKAIGAVSALCEIKDQIKDESILTILGDMYLPFPIELLGKEDGDKCCIYVSKKFKKKEIHGYGVVELGKDDRVLSFEEKPTEPKGKYVNIGVIYFPDDLIDIVSREPLRERENLVDLANRYINLDRAVAKVYNEEFFDTGTPRKLFEAALFRFDPPLYKIMKRIKS